MSDFLSAGRLEDHPFAEISGLIFQGNRTGELILENGNRRRTVWFLGGNPVAVVSDDPQDHLAQFLLEHGKIGADDAHRLADLPETREALGTADFVPKETLNWGVKSRFVNLCYDLFRWDEGDYGFHEGDPPRELFLLKVPTHSLLFKGVGLLGQAAVLDAVPDDAVCGPGPVLPADARYLTPEALHLLEQCRPGRTVAEALGAGAADIDQSRAMLYACICLGLVVLSRGPVARVAPRALNDEPEFIFGDDEAAAPPQTAGYSLDEGQPAGGALALDLPAFDSEFDSPPGARIGPDQIEHMQPPGGFPFDEESGPGSFGSYNPESTGDRRDTPPASGDEGLETPEAKPASPARRFHLPRIAGIALGSLAAAGLIGFAGWWWMSGSEPPAPPVRPPVKRPVPTAATPAPSSTAPVPGAVAQPVVPAPAPSAQTAPAPVPAPPPRNPSPSASPVAASSPAPAPAPAPGIGAQTTPATAAPSGASGADRYRAALEIFAAGDLAGAAAGWEALLAGEHRGGFTVQLLTACQPDTIREAQRSLSGQELYLVSKKVNGRACYRVCLGAFKTREVADRALAGLPGAYRGGGAAVRPVSEVLNRDR